MKVITKSMNCAPSRDAREAMFRWSATPSGGPERDQSQVKLAYISSKTCSLRLDNRSTLSIISEKTGYFGVIPFNLWIKAQHQWSLI
ncbi:hypothetical protein QE369_000295 [Agrobacterium larrymoorei]|uniref:Uncharacterized protein n=1 Tax=Agrobacterium larrymoorei TaxID=160699 RepID=A0AAJ2B810_9HYPH|nr:hypothetical protein [Agrobacterium larrymoorei]MDR6100117.1 hypothetical protein [Agrobacterium larrymoorei]